MGRIIALLTDFGVKDTYVGVMKGVMIQIFSEVNFIDLTHTIAPQHVRKAALALLSAYRFFPQNTVFLVVVDPGVGGSRRPIAVDAGGYVFVAPDNGVLSYVLAECEHYQAVELRNTEYHLLPTSQTFHGRDVFSPVAAHLASGISLDQLGPVVDDLKHVAVPNLTLSHTAIWGEVMHIDHFGNVVTSIGQFVWDDAQFVTLHPRFAVENPRQFAADQLSVNVSGKSIQGLRQTYGAVAPGESLALIGSSGFLELAVNQGDGAEHLGISIGDKIQVQMQ